MLQILKLYFYIMEFLFDKFKNGLLYDASTTETLFLHYGISHWQIQEWFVLFVLDQTTCKIKIYSVLPPPDKLDCLIVVIMEPV